MRLALTAAAVLAALSCSCARDDAREEPDGPRPPDGGGGAPDGATCPRQPGPADRPRKVVVGHPYGEDGGPANRWEVLVLEPSGELTTGAASFEMGRATLGRVVFTPDGEVGLVAQEDGTLGVFRFDEAGQPVVVHAAFSGGFYAGAVVMDPSGARAWVLDGNWRENGGGVYAVGIGCDGTLTDEGLVLPAKLPAALLLRGGRAYLAAADAGDSPAADAHVFAWSAPPARVTSARLSPNPEAILSDAALTADGRWFLVGDNAGFSSTPNSVSFGELLGDSLTARGSIDVEDPISIVGSPFGGHALVASGFGDAAFLFTLSPGDTWSAAELAYDGPPPQLPGSAVVIEAGALRGRVLLAENVAVRQLQFSPDGLTDLGPTSLGEGLPAITGAIGAQP